MSTIKIFHNEKHDSLALAFQTIAEIAEVKLEITWGSNEKESPTGRLPYIVTESGEKICEGIAIFKYIAAQSTVEHNLLGSNGFQQAQIEQWIAWGQNTLSDPFHTVLGTVMGHVPLDSAKYNLALKNVKDLAKRVDGFLKNRDFIGAQGISIADIYLLNLFTYLFGTVLDGGYRKAIPNLSAWFARVAQHPTVLKFYGSLKMCERVVKPVDTKNLKPAAAAKPAAKEEDDMDDLFGDDDDEEAAAAAKKAAEAAKEKAKGKKEKKKEIEQSLVMFEIKPLDSDTNLDEVAKRIFALKREGVFWKTEYKKEPVAFGIFKLIIGVTVIDEIASVDELQEAMEAMEDMVQSVEITAFTKI